jgi:hypothetical protein
MADPMETIEAKGPISIPVRKLVELVAESMYFQQRVKANSADEAMQFIHHPHLRASGLEEIKGPLVVISTKAFGLSRVDNKQLRPEGCMLDLTISDDVKYPDRSDWSQTDFENFVGQMLSEIASLQSEGTRLAIDSITQTIPASINRLPAGGPSQRNAYWITSFDIHWSKL